MPRYQIKYFNGRALYYSNTTASYSTLSVTLATSGDVEKNPGINGSRSEDQEPSNISRKNDQPVKCQQKNSTPMISEYFDFQTLGICLMNRSTAFF
jgi:hypothetical protein